VVTCRIWTVPRLTDGRADDRLCARCSGDAYVRQRIPKVAPHLWHGYRCSTIGLLARALSQAGAEVKVGGEGSIDLQALECYQGGGANIAHHSRRVYCKPPMSDHGAGLTPQTQHTLECPRRWRRASLDLCGPNPAAARRG